MTKRERIKAKFGGRCAYCGKKLGQTFHVDHVKPVWRGRMPEEWQDHSENNLFPACPRCNRRKSVLDLEDFRTEMGKQVDRLRRDSAAFRLAEDFGLVKATGVQVRFWFEEYQGVEDAS